MQHDANILFPVHPGSKKYLKQYKLRDKICEHVKVVPPVVYLDMLKLMSNSRKILTDSVGVQKEAYMLDIPCITMRDNTEWVETVDDGWNVLVGADYGKIVNAINKFEAADVKGNVFGSGDACEKICTLLKRFI